MLNQQDLWDMHDPACKEAHVEEFRLVAVVFNQVYTPDNR